MTILLLILMFCVSIFVNISVRYFLVFGLHYDALPAYIIAVITATVVFIMSIIAIKHLYELSNHV